MDKSKNYDIIGKIEYKKPLWDRIVDSILKGTKPNDFEPFILPNCDLDISTVYENLEKLSKGERIIQNNVGFSPYDLEHHKHFEKYLDKDERDDDTNK